MSRPLSFQQMMDRQTDMGLMTNFEVVEKKRLWDKNKNEYMFLPGSHANMSRLEQGAVGRIPIKVI